MTIYKGNCDELEQIYCAPESFIEGPLVIKFWERTLGEQLYIKVRDAAGKEGKFTLKIWGNALTTSTATVLPFNSSFFVYPNPIKVGNVLTLDLRTPESALFNVSIYNLQGQELQKHVNQKNSKNSVMSFSTAQLFAGIYFIQLKNQQQIYTQKFVVIE